MSETFPDHSAEEIASVVSDLQLLAKDGWIVADIAANLLAHYPALLQLARAYADAPRAKLEINLGELMAACLHYAPGQTVALVPVPVKEEGKDGR